MTGVRQVNFFIGYEDGISAASIQRLPATPPTPAFDAATVSGISPQGWNWDFIDLDYDGSDGWIYTFDVSAIPDQSSLAFHVYVEDFAGNYVGATTGSHVLDRMAPTSAVIGLPATSSAQFTLSWSGSDATSGVAYYDIQYREDGGNWIDWQSPTSQMSAQFSQ